MNDDVLFLPPTIIGSAEWKELEEKEFHYGPEQVLDEILDKRIWSNAEILWVIKRMIFFYGKKDALLKNMPLDRLFTNFVDVLRAFFLVLDGCDPDLDENMRIYISQKLADATWGIPASTRDYLRKYADRQ